MNTPSKLAIFTQKYLGLFMLGIASIISLSGLYFLSTFDQAKLVSFGPTAKIYFMGMKHGFAVSSLILLISLTCVIFLKKYLLVIYASARYIYRHLSETKKNIVILILCIIFSFASHSGNIMNGYFNMDDFQIMGINRVTPFGPSLLVPHGNDHTMPLFMTEMRVLDAVFGQNPIPYNTFVFILFALIPFFIFLLFKRLGISTKIFLLFLIIFSGATSWADMLSGFNIMSTYTQIILFFAVAMWAYTAWVQTKYKKYLYFFGLSTIFAITIDLPGIWVIPVIFLFMVYMHSGSLKEFFKNNRAPLIVLAGICVAFGAFFYITFHIIQPDTFLSAVKTTGDRIASVENRDANWRPLPLAENFLYFFSSGVSISLIAPNIVKILTHPSMRANFIALWPVFEILILVLNALLFYFVFKKAQNRERKYILFLIAGIFITITMVIVARPNHEVIPDFDYRYAGAAFFFYCLFLVYSGSLLIKNKGDRALGLLIPLVIIIFCAQQAFGFHAVRLKEEAIQRNQVLVRLNNTLLTELDLLKSNNGEQLLVPNLSGVNIFDQIPGFSLVDYSLFFNKKFNIKFIQNSTVLQTNNLTPVASLRASTSPEFKELLKNSPILKDYYASSGLMMYKIFDASTTETTLTTSSEKKIDILKQFSFDPEKRHIVRFILTTDEIPGNLEVTFSFKNDFGISGSLGKIRIDDYTPHTTNGDKYVYTIETDLLQLYPYAISQKISELTITVPDIKNASLFAGQLL